jgi:abortive infection bacteriophage resistance protein
MLTARGLTIADAAAAEAFLSHVNYYRFSGYCLAFEQKRHSFLPGVTFDDIRAAYAFDAHLRDLLNEALEVIEIDVRCALAYHFGKQHGAFGHIDPRRFIRQFDHAEWLNRLHEEIGRSSELFVTHFRRTYAEYPDLPIWVLTELMSFGTLTRMYRGMNKPDQRFVANRYRIQAGDFGTILLHLVYVRNLCAHHSRLWDRRWSIRPTLPRAASWRPPHVPSNERIFPTLLLSHHLLKNCAAVGTFATEWRDRLHVLFANLPKTPVAVTKLGIPADWKKNPIWIS